MNKRNEVFDEKLSEDDEKQNEQPDNLSISDNEELPDEEEGQKKVQADEIRRKKKAATVVQGYNENQAEDAQEPAAEHDQQQEEQFEEQVLEPIISPKRVELPEHTQEEKLPDPPVEEKAYVNLSKRNKYKEPV